jgi:hypothetical protein
MALVVEYLPSKHEAICSNSSIAQRNKANLKISPLDH